jgi:periodic tryptophan protein 2
VIYHFNFKAPPTCLAFSPNGRFFAIGLGKQLQIWRTPSFDEAREREFAPFVKYRTYNGHYKDVTSVSWSGDSRFLVTTGKDLTARVWSLDPVEGFTPTTLSAHRDTVVNAYFSADQEIVFHYSKWLTTDLHSESRRCTLSMDVSTRRRSRRQNLPRSRYALAHPDQTLLPST